MKVVVTGTRGIPNVMGGVETHVEELFPRIASKGVDVTVIRRSNYVSDGLASWNGVNLVDVNSPKKKAFEAIIHTFRAINKAKSLNADIIHINAIGPAMLAPYAKFRGMKVVFTHHGPDYDREKWGFAAKTMLKIGEWMGCKFADEVIVISDVIKDLIAKRCGRKDHVHLIYNGVPSPDICSYREYFDELGINEHGYVLGMCRFVPEKRLDDLVHSFVSLKNDGSIPKDLKLVLAGDTDFEDEYSLALKKLARDNGVVLTGFVKGKKLHSLLTNARCYVLPSTHEGLPIALLEAMSYNLPVIVSDIPANKEVNLPDSNYFHVKDVADLKDKLKSVLNQPFSHVEYDMSKYNWDVIADQTLSIYHDLQ